MAMIRIHPAPGVEQLPPYIHARGRAPRPGMGMLVDAYFPMPQNPVNTASNALQKSLAQVAGVPTAVGPSRVQMHGIGNYYSVAGLGAFSMTDAFGQYGQYAVYAIGALLLGYLLFGFNKKRRSGGKSWFDGLTKSTPAPAPAAAPAPAPGVVA